MIDIVELQAALKKSGNAWTAAQNPVTGLPREQQIVRLGVPLDHGEIDAVGEVLANASFIAPPTFDHRNLGGKNYVTSVKDQLNCGSCVAFGTLSTVESTYARAANRPSPNVNLSESHLFFCYAESEGRNCDTGWWPSKAYKYLISTGVADESCYEYELPSDHCGSLCADWAKRAAKISSATRMASAAQMKEWLATKGPLSACFHVYDDFFYYRTGVYRHVSGGLAGGHCISIIGYDDSQNCWICKNSWGISWGELGFFRIAYGQCNIETWETHGVSGVSIPSSP